MHPNEPEEVRRVLGWMANRAGSNWKKNPGERSMAVKLIGPNYPEFRNQAELRLFLDQNPDSFRSLDAKKFLWLEPVRHGSLAFPLMAIRYDYKKSFPALSFRVGVFVSKSGDTKSEECCIGYRFEGPEGEGNHNYYHVQHIRSFAKNALELPSPPWIPVTQPAIPLDADGPVSLLASTLVALYGRSVLEVLHGEAPDIWAAIRPRIQPLLNRFSSFKPSFYKVTESSGDAICYRTWMSEAEFIAHVAGAHPGATVGHSSATAWAGSSNSHTA